MVVWLDRATWIGDRVLLRKYVIEHAAIAWRNRLPVVTFHCTHLEGERADRDTVAVRSQQHGTRELLSFHFGGESAGHGVPAVRNVVLLAQHHQHHPACRQRFDGMRH